MGQVQSTNQENEILVKCCSDIYNDNDHRSNQLNPNNTAYWKSRGHSERPHDWTEQIEIKLPRGNDNNRANQLNPNNPKYMGSRSQPENAPDTAQRATSTTSKSWVTTGIYWIIQAGYQVYNYLFAAFIRQQGDKRLRSE